VARREGVQVRVAGMVAGLVGALESLGGEVERAEGMRRRALRALRTMF
jgi:hypothetical protein